MLTVYKTLLAKALLNVGIPQSSIENAYICVTSIIISKHDSHHKGHNMPLCGFHCCDKPLTKNNLGRKEVICVVGFSPPSMKARTGIQGRNQPRGSRPWRNTGLFPVLSLPSRTTQNHLPRSGTAHSGLSPPKSIINHESVALTCLEAGLVEGILHHGRLLPGDSRLCQVDKNQPAHTTFSATHMTLVGSCRDSENSTSPSEVDSQSLQQGVPFPFSRCGRVVLA